ncbi:hypothetical protein FA13DRAFT_163615 [Coprinellus micaceus]|uniref:Uncharacterized protein n=1 Tax=Coprinellus micaceus TaxID=71717 RepID=A0A4Y7TI15_COPMI|nr:hypothetical protein FA13DRAFT_163615 [Coprinellus micaceus]
MPSADNFAISQLHEDLLIRVIQTLLSGTRGGRQVQLPTREQRTHLRGVCRRWNRIVLDSPMLWKEVELRVQSTHQATLDDELRRLRFSLDRGGDVMRHLVLNIDAPLAETNATPLLDAIRAEQNWVHVSITSSGASISSSLFAPLQPSHPISPWRFLRFLHIAEPQVLSIVPQVCSFNLSPEDAPALREVVAGIGAGDLRQCILPWGQLSHISLGPFANNVSDYLEVLSRCLRAEKCVFEPPAWATRDELPPAVDNTLSSPLPIRSFCIQFPRFTSRATALMDRLSTPELKELSLSSTSLDVASDVGAIQSAERLIRRSMCNITALQLGVNNLGPRNPELLAPILNAVSESLLSLSLVMYGAATSYFTTVAPGLPRLKVLQLVNTGHPLIIWRDSDVGNVVRWAQTWTSSISAVLPEGQLSKRKDETHLTYVWISEPNVGFFNLHKNPDYCRNGRSDTTHPAVQQLNEDGWHLDIIVVGPGS